MRLLFSGSNAMIDHIGQIFALIRHHDGVTRHFLAEQLALPATTLNRSLDRLLAAGLIRESGLADSSGGRRPSLYQINEQSGQLMGLDLSEANARLVLTDLNLQVLETARLPAWTSLDNKDLPAAVAGCCQEMLRRNQKNSRLVLGLGISRQEKGSAESGQLPDDPALAGELGLPVYWIDSDCAALYAGLWGRLIRNAGLSGTKSGSEFGSGQSLLILWNGEPASLGQGRFVNPARIVTSVGAIGQMIVPLPEKKSGAGTNLSRLATVPAMVHCFQVLKDDPSLTWQDLCQAAQAGKRKAGKILLDAAQALAIAVLNILLGTGIRNLLWEGSAFQECPEYEAAFHRILLDQAAGNGLDIRILAHPYGLDLRAAGAAAVILEQALNIC